MPTLQVGTILLAPVIVGLVEMAKKLGLPSKYAPWLNGGLAVLGYGLVVLTELVPGSLEFASYGLNALVVFLLGAGLYDRAQGSLTSFRGWLYAESRQ